MQVNDPIADMLTRIRNANHAKHSSVDIPASKIKKAIADILLKEGYVEAVNYLNDSYQGTVRITLKYVGKKRRVLSGLRRVSKPGLRAYSPKESLPRVLKGLGTAIISTSKGVMTDRDARKNNVGGEVLAFIW